MRAQRALQCLPALGATLDWSCRLCGRPGAAPLLGMLSKFEARLRAQLAAYVEERVATIQRWVVVFGGVGKGGVVWDGVNWGGVECARIRMCLVGGLALVSGLAVWWGERQPQAKQAQRKQCTGPMWPSSAQREPLPCPTAAACCGAGTTGGPPWRGAQ